MDSSNKSRAVFERPPRALSARSADREEEKGGAASRAAVNGRALREGACAVRAGGSVEDVSSECGDCVADMGGDGFLSSTSLLYSAPSSISDFTERWLTEVMRQYYATQFGQKNPLPQGIGNFSVEMAGNNEINEEKVDGEVQVRRLYNFLTRHFSFFA